MGEIMDGIREVREPACSRAGKWFGACRFEARYDTAAPTITTQEAAVLFQELEAFELSRPATYVRDICTRCGKVVPRGTLADAAPRKSP